MHRFIPVSEEGVDRRDVRSGGGGPVHTIDARPAYGRRASLAMVVRLLRRTQRRRIADLRRREEHHARHQPQRRPLTRIARRPAFPHLDFGKTGRSLATADRIQWVRPSLPNCPTQRDRPRGDVEHVGPSRHIGTECGDVRNLRNSRVRRFAIRPAGTGDPVDGSPRRDLRGADGPLCRLPYGSE